MSTAGSIRVSRGFFEDEAFADEAMTEREAFLWLIMEASFKAREKRFGAAVVTLERGQLAASTRFMAKAWTWSEARVRRYLDRLKNRRMVACDTDAGVTVITVCNYDKYQSGACDSDAPATQQPTHRRRVADANENKGEIRIRDIPDGISLERASKRARKPEMPIPENWCPSDRNIADAEARHFSSQEIAHEADRFRDHHLARGNLMRDWDAAWRTWLANARKFGGGRLAGPSGAGGRGPGSSIASIAAWRRATGAV